MKSAKAPAKPKYAHAGAPTLYRPEYCAVVEELGRKGKGPEQIAAVIDVVPATLYNWAEEHPEFLIALTRAKNLEQEWWENVGQTALFADKFQAQVWSKSMAARFRNKYTEKVVQENTGLNGGPIQHVHTIERRVVRPADD